MAANRRQYTAEFKAKVVLQVFSGLDAYKPYLQQQWSLGQQQTKAQYEDIQQQGYPWLILQHSETLTEEDIAKG